LATAVDTPPLDTLDLATLVVTTASVRLKLSPRLMLMLRLIPTTDTATTVPTPSEPSTLPRGRLRLMLRLRPIPTTDTATPDLATLA